MSCEPDQWAKEWLAARRAEGKTGLTVEKKGSVHYLKWATTKWDPEKKKRRKVSEYRGVLNEDGSITEPRPRHDRSVVQVGSIVDSGNARVLRWTSKKVVKALESSFPDDYPEIVELAWTRILGKGELNKTGRCWKRLENVLGIHPNTSPKSLSESLERIGKARVSQGKFFDSFEPEDSEMALDLSVIFSKSRGAFMSKRGYNRFRLSCPQFNLLMGCGLKSGRPRYMRVLPGNLKEGGSVTLLDELDIPKGTLLVMDRGYYDKKLLKSIREKGLDYLVAVKRSSTYYDKTNVDDGYFRWRESVVRYGVAEIDGEWVYRFENLTQRNDEIVDALKALDKGLNRKVDEAKAGNFIMVSSRKMEPQEAYVAYKHRSSIEDGFDTGKNLLDMDRTYMHSDQHVMGHLFVTYVALMMIFDLEDRLRSADLLSRYSVSDVLDIYSTMKIVESEKEVRQLVPKDVRDLDSALGINLYTEGKGEVEPQSVKKKRGRKPKASSTQ